MRHEEAGALCSRCISKANDQKLVYARLLPDRERFNLLNGLYDAKLDKVPVLALTGQGGVSILSEDDAFQEINLERMFDDVAVYNQRIMSAEQLPLLSIKPIRTAYS